MSSLVPEGWSRKKLGDSLIPRPKSKLPSGESNPLGYYDFYVCSHKVLKSFHNEYSSPSILFSTGGEASVHLATERYAFSTDVWATEFEGDICNDYVFRLLEENIRTINYSGFQGSGIKHLDKSFIEKLEFSIPPLPEQKKIASILTSVDEVIENAQKHIDKLQDLKKATMNELLTKGIGHTEFKDSELGRIPKSWEVVSLRSLASQIKRGPSLSCNTNGHGVRYITSGNLVAGEVSLNGDYKFLDNFSDIEKCRLVANDLVLNCVNSSAKIGESAIFELDIKAIVGFNNYAITLDSAVCVPRFIHHFCQTYLFRAQLKTVIKDAINQVSFSSKDLDLIRIALPSLDEQNRIAESVNVIWMKEKTNQSQIDKLKSLKKSLMQDLLTGKVRVTVN